MSIIMTIKHGLHPFFLIDMKVTAKIPWPQLYRVILNDCSRSRRENLIIKFMVGAPHNKTSKLCE
jgi:hypothetical protein